MTALQRKRHLYPTFQYKVTETPENIAEKSFTSAWLKEGGLLQNLTSKGGTY